MDDWRSQAACRGMDPEAFHPRVGAGEIAKLRRAQAVCATCPVTEPCLAFALSRPIMYDRGVWGGTSERDRKRIRLEARELTSA